MSKSLHRNVDIPLLKAYLKATPSYPDFVPAWVPFSSWAIFGVLTFLLAFEMGLVIFGTAIAGAIAYGYFLLLRTRYKATTDQQRADEKQFDAVRKFKRMEGEGNLAKRIPVPVLEALERTIAERNAAVARLAVGDPVDAMETTKRLDQTVRACLVAAVSLARHDEHSRRDWEAIKANDGLINDIVDVINHQAARMREPFMMIDTERLSALRELDGETPPALRMMD